MKDTNMWVWVVLVAAGLILGITRVDKYLKIKALDDCAKSARQEVKSDEWTTVSYPLEEVYKKCVSEKGY